MVRYSQRGMSTELSGCTRSIAFNGNALYRVRSDSTLAKTSSLLLCAHEASLPLPDNTPIHPGDIAVDWGPAPTPAKKWVIERRHYDLFSGTHWVSWLPLKGTRRMTWVKWR